MGLLSTFKRKTDAPSATAAARPSPGGVQQARTRARQRLVGAVVLVVIGVIAFPLVFESQPRPIPIDIPIEIPRKDGAPALVMPSARPSPVAPAPARTVVEEVKPEAAAATDRTATATAVPPAAPPTAPTAGAQPVAPVEPAPKPVVPKAADPEPAEASKKAAAPASLPSPPATPAPVVIADAAKAKALLEGKPVAAKEAARFVVQVGAFAESGAAQDTRAKLEKLGLKSFTQVTETAAGSRTRVRLGPFATREEAERVLAKTKAAGLDGVVLTL